MLSLRTVRRYIKPPLFLLCLFPAAGVVAGAFGAFDLGANPIEAIQDTLGIWGLRLLVLTLAITPLKDWTGQTSLIALRRMLGLFAFFYVLAHFLTWLILDQGMYWDGILKDIAKRPFITIGFAALLLLMPLALTSTRGMMRRLGRRWQQLHRAIYAIAILGVWHYWWQVKADFREPLIYAVLVSVLLGWRVYAARRRSRSFVARKAVDASNA
ncbi:MAG: protein-methionine-sulfoxide reductase heme-binding subunit MsrQ [Steroidobacteraceae bacterium]